MSTAFSEEQEVREPEEESSIANKEIDSRLIDAVLVENEVALMSNGNSKAVYPTIPDHFAWNDLDDDSLRRRLASILPCLLVEFGDRELQRVNQYGQPIYDRSQPLTFGPTGEQYALTQGKYNYHAANFVYNTAYRLGYEVPVSPLYSASSRNGRSYKNTANTFAALAGDPGVVDRDYFLRYFDVIARPGQSGSLTIRPGDILLRGPEPEAPFGHIAIIVDPTFHDMRDPFFASRDALRGRGVQCIDAGLSIHRRENRYGQVLTDEQGKVFFTRMVLRFKEDAIDIPRVREQMVRYARYRQMLEQASIQSGIQLDENVILPDEEFFVDAGTGITEERTSHLIGYQLESPFQYAFRQEDEAFDEGEEVDRYSDNLDEQELEELEESVDGAGLMEAGEGSADSSDLTVAVPSFTPAKRTIISPVLNSRKNAEALQWNQDRHPAASGVDPKAIRAVLTRYVNFDAVNVAITNYNVAHPKAPIVVGTPPIDAVFVEAVHQFQAKCFGEARQQDGMAGESALDSLGLVTRTGLNTVDQRITALIGTDSKARRRLNEVAGKLGGSTAKDWYQNMVNPTFLGQTFKNGIHIILARKLRIAESYLLSLPAYAGMTPVELCDALGINEDHKGGRPNPNSASMHTFGLAVDIKYEANPWVGGQHNSQTGNQQFSEAMKHAVLLISGPSISFPLMSEYFHSLGTNPRMSTADIYDTLYQRDLEFRAYLQLVSSIESIKHKLRDRRNGRTPGVFESESETIEAAADRWQKMVRADLSNMRASDSNFGSNRNPLKGFLNLPRDLVIALRDHACLAWGAVDIGPKESGDMMHFDCRVDDVGKILNQGYAPKRGQPCLSSSLSQRPAESLASSLLTEDTPRRISPEDVSSEMVGRRFKLNGPFTSGSIQLTGSETVEVLSWANVANVVKVKLPSSSKLGNIPFDIPKRLLRGLGSTVSGIAAYSAGISQTVKALEHGEQKINDERTRRGGPRPGELPRLQSLQQRREQLLNKRLIQEQMFNRFDETIKKGTDFYNAQFGFTGTDTLEPNLVKSLLFQESQLGTAGEHLQNPPSHPVKTRFNLGQVIDSSAQALLIMMQEMQPALITTFHLMNIKADLAAAQRELSALKKVSRPNAVQQARLNTLKSLSHQNWENFLWQYKEAGQTQGFNDAVTNFFASGTPARNVDYEFWIRAAIRWLFEKRHTVKSWDDAIRAYNGSGTTAEHYRKAIVERAQSATTSLKQNQEFIPENI